MAKLNFEVASTSSTTAHIDFYNSKNLQLNEFKTIKINRNSEQRKAVHIINKLLRSDCNADFS
ncbi:MAG: hypothetical protein ACK5NB_05220 [Flavobacteriaceae bacterium]